MDFGSIFGLLIGVLLLFSALGLEAGSFWIIFQPIAFMVVIGGSLASVTVNFSLNQIISTYKEVQKLFIKSDSQPVILAAQILEISTVARQSGLLALQGYVNNFSNPFLSHCLKLSLDINSSQLLKEIFYSELKTEEENLSKSANVLEALGGYAPTFGILGAVIGLIGVMKHLENPGELGRGIAVAFVATLYGVGFANIIFLPLAGKLRLKSRENLLINEMIAEGILAVHNGENTSLIEEKLIRYLKHFNSSMNLSQIFFEEEVA